MAVEVGTAYVSIVPSFRGFDNAIKSQVSSSARTIETELATAGERGGAEAGKRAGSSFGSNLGSAVKSTASVVAGAAVGIVTAAGGVAAAMGAIGIKSAASMEQNKVAFTTLIGDSGKAQAKLDELAKFAASTPFTMPGLIDASRQLLGVGESADDVIPTLTAFGDSAGALGLSQDQFNHIMLATTQAMANGKIQAGDMLQITQAGLPIWSLLSEALGKPVSEVRKLSEQGKLLTADVLPKLQAQMEKDYGGSMARQSQTLNGVWSTLTDNINIGLGKALTPLIPTFVGITTAASNLISQGLAKLTQWISTEALPWIHQFQGDWANVQSGTFGGEARKAIHDISDALHGLFTGHGGETAKSLGDIGNSLKQAMPAVKEMTAELPNFNDLLRIGSTVIKFAADHLDLLGKALPFVVAGYIAYKGVQSLAEAADVVSVPIKAAQVASNFALARSQRAMVAALEESRVAQAGQNIVMTEAVVVESEGTVARARGLVTLVAQRVATFAVAAATRAWSIAQFALNAVMDANPIALIILGIIALVAAIVLAYQHSQTFRDIVHAAFHGIADAALWMWNTVLMPVFHFIADHWLLLLGVLLPGVALVIANWDLIKAAALFLWNNVLLPVWGAMVATWNGLVAAFVWAWNNIGGPLFSAIAAIAGWLWDTILKVVFFAIKLEWLAVTTALKWAWDNVLRPVFNAVAAVASWLWDTVLKIVFAVIKAEWSALVAALKWAWDNVLHPVWSAVAAAAQWLWNNALRPTWNAIKEAWSALVSAMKWAWENILKPAWDGMQLAAHTLGDLLGKAFDGLKEAFTTAFRFAKQAVVGGWNDIADWVNKNVIIPINGTFHIGISPVPRFATGGAVRGRGTSTSDSIPALVSDGEFIINAAAVRAIGLDTLNQLNAAHRINFQRGDASGMAFTLPGFAAGGNVDAARSWAQAQAGKPYVMGAAGPDAYDCSGFIGDIWAILTGNPLYRRYFDTSTEMNGFFKPGLGGPHDFNVGWYGGTGADGHTAGTLAGLGVEATPPHVLVGNTFAHPGDAMFTGKGHLPLGEHTIWGWLYDHTIGEVKDALHAAMAGLANNIPDIGFMGKVFKDIATSAIDLMPFDGGGLLMPGHVGVNLGSRPEPVLTPEQWDAAMASGSGSTVNVYPQRADFTIADLEALQARQDALARVRRAR